MKLLQDKILKEGTVLEENILKVDSFLNHQMEKVGAKVESLAILDKIENGKVYFK